MHSRSDGSTRFPGRGLGTLLLADVHSIGDSALILQEGHEEWPAGNPTSGPRMTGRAVRPVAGDSALYLVYEI